MRAAPPSARIAAPRTSPLLSPKGLLLTSSASTTTGVSSFTLVSGSAWKTVLPSLPFCVLPACNAATSRSSSLTPFGSVTALCSTPNRPPRNSPTLPSASMATTAPSDTLRVVCTSVADAPGLTASRRRAVGGARGGEQRDELVELVGDDGGVVGEAAAGGVGGGATGEAGGDRGGHHEGPERDRDHRDEEAGPQTAGAARAAGHGVGLGDLDDSSRYPTPRTVVIVAASPSFLRTCAMCTSTVRASPNQS